MGSERVRRGGIGKMQSGSGPIELIRKRRKTLRGYRWSSHPAYAGWVREPEWLTERTVLSEGRECGLEEQRAVYRTYAESALALSTTVRRKTARQTRACLGCGGRSTHPGEPGAFPLDPGHFPGAQPPQEFWDGTPVQMDGEVTEQGRIRQRKVWDFADTNSKNIRWRRSGPLAMTMRCGSSSACSKPTAPCAAFGPSTVWGGWAPGRSRPCRPWNEPWSSGKDPARS